MWVEGAGHNDLQLVMGIGVSLAALGLKRLGLGSN